MIKQDKKKKALAAGGILAASLLVTGWSSSAWAQFVEGGTDAGQTLATAQATAGGSLPAGSALTTITGNLSSVTDSDLFVITLTAPGTFSATTAAAGATLLDTQISLFGASGAAIALNDDAPGGQSLASTLSAGNALYATLGAGTYYLAISLSGNDPVNLSNQSLFVPAPGGDTTATRGAQSGVNPATLGGFANSNADPLTNTLYRVDLTSTAAAVPEPSTCVLLTFSVAASLSLLRKGRRSVA